MIPDEAVEAAAEAFWARRQDLYVDRLMAALEAAAPHLMAEWESNRKSEAETQKEPKVIPVPRSAVTNLYRVRK